jgi:hypothetical protein
MIGENMQYSMDTYFSMAGDAAWLFACTRGDDRSRWIRCASLEGKKKKGIGTQRSQTLSAAFILAGFPLDALPRACHAYLLAD